MIERRKSKIEGWGVFATETIPKNKRIIHYAGEKIPNKVSLEREAKYLAEGHFPPGSMGPKIEAALAFVEGGREAIITDPPNLCRALRGETGTRILPG